MNCSPPDSSVQGDSPSNTGVGCHPLLQGIFPTQGSNPGLSNFRKILYGLSHQGSPRILGWVAYPFSSGSSQLRNQTGVSFVAGRFFFFYRLSYQGSPDIAREDRKTSKSYVSPGLCSLLKGLHLEVLVTSHPLQPKLPYPLAPGILGSKKAHLRAFPQFPEADSLAG